MTPPTARCVFIFPWSWGLVVNYMAAFESLSTAVEAYLKQLKGTPKAYADKRGAYEAVVASGTGQGAGSRHQPKLIVGTP